MMHMTEVSSDGYLHIDPRAYDIKASVLHVIVTVLFTQKTPNSEKTRLVFVRSRSSWNLSWPLTRCEKWRS